MPKNNLITKEFKIKGMICSRCLKVLSSELKVIGAVILNIELGKVVIKYNPKLILPAQINKIITENDFQIIWNDETIKAEKTKRWIIHYVWNTEMKVNLSEYLVKAMSNRYESLSKNFSKIFGKTIERYCILLKIERAKELIEMNNTNFSDIAFLLSYQNLSSLSRQFKSECGMTLKKYKSLNISQRIPIDKI